MDDLRRMLVFYQVVQAQSFAGAARRLGIARSAVSRHIALLEKHLGVRLLNRSTRRLSLTAVGATYYQSCERIVEEAQAAERRVSELQEEPLGTLKVAAPIHLRGDLMARVVADFARRYPSLSVELIQTERVVDMIAEGIDVSIRAGWLRDSTLIARKLAEAPRVLCASPDYLEQRGRAQTPQALSAHEWLIFTLLPTPYHYSFTRNGREQRIQVKGRLKTNNADTLRTLALEGMGIALLSEFMVAQDLRDGRLERLLPDYDCGSAGIYAVYAERRYQQAKLRLFIDFIAQRFKQLA